MKKVIFFLVTVLALSACTKESISPTQGQLNATRLKNAIGNTNITSLFVQESNVVVFNANVNT